jgi:hypothetical protein
MVKKHGAVYRVQNIIHKAKNKAVVRNYRGFFRVGFFPKKRASFMVWEYKWGYILKWHLKKPRLTRLTKKCLVSRFLR